MSGLLRRVRGAIGMGITWALGWTPIGALAGATLAVVFGPGIPLFWAMKLNAVVFGVLGLIGGTIFSTVLRLTEGRRTFDELTLPRFTLWGALGGVVLGGVTVALGLWGAGNLPGVAAMLTGITTVLGAASAAGTLAIARAADRRERLGASSEVDAVGLSGDEATHLLGPTS
jgi:hypothetical protein